VGVISHPFFIEFPQLYGKIKEKGVISTKVTYIHHSGFLVETDRFYYLFDYESGALPTLDPAKPIYVLSSHSHEDHYNPDIFPQLAAAGMTAVHPILSEDIEESFGLSVAPGMEYNLGEQHKLTTFRSTDLGVAFLMEDQGKLIYHAGDLNDWVWAEETETYNGEMTANYRKEIQALAETLGGREVDIAMVVLDPRQEKDYDRGMCYFLEHIPAKKVYPMHYWDDPSVIGKFLTEHPQYTCQIQRTE
jgi:L-ascorbate metabolism protein UlaG (beta-lactamase superfamily)